MLKKIVSKIKRDGPYSLLVHLRKRLHKTSLVYQLTLPRANLQCPYCLKEIRDFSQINPEHFSVLGPRKLDVFKQRLDNPSYASIFLVDQREGRLLGYVWYSSNFIEDTSTGYYHPLKTGQLGLLDLYIFPSHRGQGLSKFLVCSLGLYASSYCLLIDQDNLVSRQLFEGLGAENIGSFRTLLYPRPWIYYHRICSDS